MLLVWRGRRDRSTVLCTSGMAAEARVARAAGFSAIVGAENPASIAVRIQKTAPQTKCLISFGVAGGLAPYLRPGDVLLSTEVIGDDRCWVAAAPFRCGVIKLAQQLGVFAGPLLGSDVIIARTQEKRRAWRETGALAVDLESAVVASAAEAAQIPFLVLRAIADPATREVPSAALIPFASDESSVLLRLVAQLLRQPRQIAALFVLAFEMQCALAALAAPARALHQAADNSRLGLVSFDLGWVDLPYHDGTDRLTLDLAANRGCNDPNSSRADWSSANRACTLLPSGRSNVSIPISNKVVFADVGRGWASAATTTANTAMIATITCM